MKVAIIGHRTIDKTPELIDRLTNTITDLIVNEGADTFLFGSKSEFNSLCYEIVTELRYKYPHIKRIYERAECKVIPDFYLKKVLTYFEDTFYSDKVDQAGRLAYVVRNEIMVLACDVLLVYYDSEYHPASNKNSGTRLAVTFAQKKQKRVINVF